MGDTSKSAVRSRLRFEYARTLAWLVAPLAVTTQIVLDARLGDDLETPFWGVLSYNLPRWVVWTPLSVWVQWLAGSTRSWRLHGISALLCVGIASAAWTLQATRLRNYSQVPPPLPPPRAVVPRICTGHRVVDGPGVCSHHGVGVGQGSAASTRGGAP